MSQKVIEQAWEEYCRKNPPCCPHHAETFRAFFFRGVEALHIILKKTADAGLDGTELCNNIQDEIDEFYLHRIPLESEKIQ